ncbi:DUF502 domain-containing protein [Gallaecimonas mangrovi]|uniref:DUF502 domain-containing protein n=1 Tax=Gallaecimonas mangrovi TaxID=2291597 RepID=UPI000E20B29C|nr:DUF502 domain-containing protein [Gallaecimonas mangrovi]
MLRLFKTTIVAGVVFLFPFVIGLWLIASLLQLLTHIATPLIKLWQLGPLTADLLVLVMLLAICLLAGLVARSQAMVRLAKRLENWLSERVPVYAFLKTRATNTFTPTHTEGLKVVAARFDDCWQLAFEMERTGTGMVLLFLPGAPDPWSGNCCLMAPDRVTPLAINARDVLLMSGRLGAGMGQWLAAAAEGKAP